MKCYTCGAIYDGRVKRKREEHIHLDRLTKASSTTDTSVLAEADNIVTGDRQKDYGHPLDNFTDIADMWTVILRKTRGGDNFSKIRAEEVALMMDVMKVSREINTPKRDNRVDGPGYWKCLDMIIEERKRRAEEPF